MSDLHVLKQLQLPDRYENLKQLLGDRIAELIVEPSEAVVTEFRRAGDAIAARGEGAYLPLVGGSGVGKTTWGIALVYSCPEPLRRPFPMLVLSTMTHSTPFWRVPS